MKKFDWIACVIGLAVSFSCNGFAETENEASLMQMQVLSGPGKVTLQDTVMTLTENDAGISFGNKIVEDVLKSEAVYTIISRSKEPGREEARQYYYNYIKTGYFENASLNEGDLSSIFKTEAEPSMAYSFYKDNNQRYIIKSIDKETNIAEYAAILLFRSGVGIVSAEYKDESISKNYMFSFINFTNSIQAKEGYAYQDYRNGDKKNSDTLKGFLTQYFEEKEETSSQGGLLSFLENQKVTKKTSPSTLEDVNNINVVAELKQSILGAEKAVIPSEEIPAEPQVKRERYTFILIIGAVFVFFGIFKGFIGAFRKHQKDKKEEALGSMLTEVQALAEQKFAYPTIPLRTMRPDIEADIVIEEEKVTLAAKGRQ